MKKYISKSARCDIMNIRKQEEYYMLKIIRARDYKDMSRKAANIISAQIILKNDSV